MRNNLKKTRKALYTQSELAKKLGIGVRHYKALEAGTSNGTIPIWERLKKITGESIDYLLEQTDDEENENTK